MATEPTDDLLQRYFDGDLGELEAESVRQLVVSSEEAQGRLRGLARLRELVAADADHGSQGLDADALFARVEQGIEVERKLGRGPELHVLPGSGPKKRDTSTLWVAAAALVAAAAVVALVLSPGVIPFPTEGVQTPQTSTKAPGVMEIDEPVAAVIERPQGTEVEQVDFGASTGTVFEVEGDAGEPIAVVWINDEGQGL